MAAKAPSPASARATAEGNFGYAPAGQPASLTHTDTNALARAGRIVNAMTVDVEDYFHVEAFKDVIPAASWDSMPQRAERNTHHVLQLLDDAGVRGTFFVLGWIARRHPALVRAIAERGHEVASHGSDHARVDSQQPDVFFADIASAKALLEDLTGCRVRGYRAPTFSIGPHNWWAYDKLAEAGYEYSSSVYPISHDLYGMPDAPRSAFRPADGALLEIPMTTLRLFNCNFPCAGGGYFRLLPYRLSRWGMRRVNERDGMAGVFYCHPWEFDTGQPRLRGSAKARFRHYLNIGAMTARFSRLLREFSWGRMDRVFLSGDS